MLGGVLGVRESDRTALEGDVSGVVGLRPRQSLDQRRLSRAIVADERGDLARVNRHIHALQDLDGAEALADVLQLDDGGFHVFSLAAVRSWWPCASAGCTSRAHGHRKQLGWCTTAGLLEAGLLAGRGELFGADLR